MRSRRTAKRLDPVLGGAFLVAIAMRAAAQTPAPTETANESPNAPPSSELPPLADTLTGRAKDDYKAAWLLYDDKDYAGALVKFESAYDASKDARLLWNAATCEKNLRHYAKAVGFVTRYLAAGPPYVTPELRHDAETFLDAVKPLTAHATIVTAEPDANVSLDGEVIGTTPLTESVLIDIGSHRISVQKNGFKSFSKTINVTGSAQIRIEAVLEKIVHQGRLVVHAGVGDTISLDDRGVGSGTWEATLPSGGHMLRVTAPDKIPFQSDVLVQDGETRRVDVTLEQASSGIPAWVWILGSAVVIAGAATGGYFALKPSDTRAPTTPGTLLRPGSVQLQLMR